MDGRPRAIEFYLSETGRFPARDWLDGLGDLEAQKRLWVRIRRLERGNLGQWRSVGGGVIELKMNKGPGYRLYIGEDGPVLVLLLLGGTKAGQAADIRTAQTYWVRYLADKAGKRRRYV